MGNFSLTRMAITNKWCNSTYSQTSQSIPTTQRLLLIQFKVLPTHLSRCNGITFISCSLIIFLSLRFIILRAGREAAHKFWSPQIRRLSRAGEQSEWTNKVLLHVCGCTYRTETIEQGPIAGKSCSSISGACCGVPGNRRKGCCPCCVFGNEWHHNAKPSTDKWTAINITVITSTCPNPIRTLAVVDDNTKWRQASRQQ